MKHVFVCVCECERQKQSGKVSLGQKVTSDKKKGIFSNNRNEYNFALVDWTSVKGPTGCSYVGVIDDELLVRMTGMGSSSG